MTTDINNVNIIIRIDSDTQHCLLHIQNSSVNTYYVGYRLTQSSINHLDMRGLQPVPPIWKKSIQNVVWRSFGEQARQCGSATFPHLSSELLNQRILDWLFKTLRHNILVTQVAIRLSPQDVRVTTGRKLLTALFSKAKKQGSSFWGNEQMNNFMLSGWP